VLDARGVPPADPLAAAASTAAELREHRRQLAEAISAGTVSLADLRAAADPLAATVKVLTLAEAVPGVGKVASRRILADLGIADGTRWGELAPSTTDRLLAALARTTGGGA
jgi:hypothetical protein